MLARAGSAMRFVLRLGTREVLVCTRDRFKRFDSTNEATEFLARYAMALDNFRALRASLSHDPRYTALLKLNQPQLIIEVARMLVEGRVNLLPDADGLPPWTWTFPLTPTSPWNDSSAALESNALVNPDDETGEDEDENLDEKPEPVLPPEFPRLAKEEADALAFESKKYGFKLDLLQHVDTDYPPGSELAEEFTKLAKSQGSALVEKAVESGPLLSKLATKGGDSPARTQVGEQFGAVVQEQDKTLKTLAERIGDFLRAVLSGAPPEDPLRTELGPALRTVHEGQGKNLGAAAEGLGQRLDALAPDKEEKQTKPESGVSASLRNLHGEHAEKLAGTATDLLGALDDANKLPAVPTEPGWVRFRIVDEATGEPLRGYKLVVRGELGKEIELDDGGSGLIEAKDLPEGPVGLVRIIDNEAYEVVEVVAEEGDPA